MPATSSQIVISNSVYQKVEDPKTVRIAGKIYVLAQMTGDEAASVALDISTDSSALALVFQENGLKEQAGQAREVAKLFSSWADELPKFL